MLLSLTTFGQGALTDFKRLQLGVFFSPDLAKRVLKDANQKGFLQFGEDYADFKIGFTTGVVLCYNASPNWGIEFGLQYANKGYQMSTSDLIYGDYIGGNRVYMTADPNIETYNRRMDYLYAGIPFRVIWSAGQGNLRFVSSLGITSHFLLKVIEVNTLKFENGNSKRDDYEILNEYNRFSLSPSFSLGADYQVAPMFNLRFEPTLRFGLIEIGDTTRFSNKNEHLMSIGFSFACYYTLK